MFENSFTIFVVKRFTIKRKRIHVSDTWAWVLVSLVRSVEERPVRSERPLGTVGGVGVLPGLR